MNRRRRSAEAGPGEEKIGDSQSYWVAHGLGYGATLEKIPLKGCRCSNLVFPPDPYDIPPMDEELDAIHWAYVEKSRAAATPEGQAEILRTQLGQLALEEIAAFDHWFWQQMQLLYSWELWGVATLAGNDGEEAFLRFRGWVVSLGKEAALAAAADADSLADHIFAGAAAPDFCHAGRDAYEAQAGSELPTATLNLFAQPRGTPVQNSELTTRFPNVSAALAR